MAKTDTANLPPLTSGTIKDIDIDVKDKNIMFNELSATNVFVHESLLSPTVQISITMVDTIHLIKNFLQYKVNKNGEMPNMSMTLINPMFDVESDKPQGVTRDAELPLNNFRVYRMDHRRPLNYHMEQYTLHLCAPSIINNQIYRMSDFYGMTELSKIVNDAMESAGIPKYNREIEKTDIKRDYISNNQHPFQVISELSDMAMKDRHAQFFHFNTTENVSGKHYFVSMKKLIDKAEKIDGKKVKADFEYQYNEKGLNITFGIHDIMTYEFPCDFDTLLDLSGGIIHNEANHKNHKPSMVSINPFDGGIFLVDGKYHGDNRHKGFGGVLNAGAWSNLNNFEYGLMRRPSGVEHYLHKRTENVTFLHREKIDLKIVVPFNPKMHVGKLIDVSFFSKRENGPKFKDFGSGVYLVVHMTHDIKIGNYGTTILECIRVKNTSDYYKELRPDHQILPKLLKEKK